MYRSTELGGLHKDSDTDVLYASKDFLDSILEETDKFKQEVFMYGEYDQTRYKQ